MDGVPSTRFSHFTSSSSSFLANQRLPPHRSSSQSGHPVNTPLLANDDDVSAEQWHDDGVVTSNGGTREGSARGYAGANYAVVSGSKGDVSGDNMTKRAQQRARLVSFGGSDDEDDEASELVAFMNDEDVNRLWDSPKVRAMPILYYLLVGFVDYIDLPPKGDYDKTSAEKCSNTFSFQSSY